MCVFVSGIEVLKYRFQYFVFGSSVVAAKLSFAYGLRELRGG